MFADIILPMLAVAALTVVVAPLVALVAAPYYAGVVLARAVRVLADGYGVRADSPGVPIPAPPKKFTDGLEPAYLHYTSDQAWRDAWYVAKQGWQGVYKTIATSGRQVNEHYFPDSSARKLRVDQNNPQRGYPIGIGLFLGVGLGACIAGLVLLLVVLGAAVTLGLLFAGAFVARYALRGVDTTFLYVRGITLTCKHCARRVPFPEYDCPGCRVRHRDLRPGRYGLTHRTCSCKARFPSLVLLKSYKLDGCCPYCQRSLAKDTGSAAEIIIPVFGASGAGKTQLMIVLMIVVETLAYRGRGSFEFADDNTRIRSAEARRSLRASNQVKKTDAQELPPAFSMHVNPQKGTRRLIHLFDAAGEIFETSQRIQELRQLTLARTFVFVVDPLSISQVWQSLDTQQQAKWEKAKATVEPRKIFEETVQTVRKMGIDTGKVRLVVAVSKADLITVELRRAGVDDDESIREWLCDTLEQDNMVRAMDHHFRDVSFFLTSAMTDEHDRADHSIEAFVIQTLAEEGLRL